MSEKMTDSESGLNSLYLTTVNAAIAMNMIDKDGSPDEALTLIKNMIGMVKGRQAKKCNAKKVSEMKRLTIAECQRIYDRYGVDGYEHTGLTTDLCMIIKDLEKGS